MDEIILLREQWSIAYSTRKGWGCDLNRLTLDQIMEIRNTDLWKNIPELVERGFNLKKAIAHFKTLSN